MRKILAALLLAATLLAGCAGGSGGDGDKAKGDGVKLPGLVATDTTGVIKGVVVDEAIRPIVNATVGASRGEGQEVLKTKSDADGYFGFRDLEPGTWFVGAAKAGYFNIITNVDVVAADSDPPAVKLLLVRDVENTPYSELHKFDGYIECGLSVIALCGAGQGLPAVGNATNDRFAGAVPIARPPTFVQSELVWEPTTSAGDQLWLWHSRQTKGGGYNGSCDCWVQGRSPLIIATNETGAADNDYGTTNDVWLRVFTGSIEGTRNPLDDRGCYEAVVTAYCGGVGYSLQQPFTIYTTVFYGYLPPAGWSFSAAGSIPQPE